MPYPFQILQGHREILIAYQFGKANRVIHMNQKKESTVDSWMGMSSGKWDGDTLVVDVEGLNGLAWLDRSGNFISEAARVQERYTPISPYHMRYEATITDPQTFTRPWKMSMTLYRVIDQGAEMHELNCVEFSEEAMYGALRMRDKVSGNRRGSRHEEPSCELCRCAGRCGRHRVSGRRQHRRSGCGCRRVDGEAVYASEDAVG